MIRSYFLFFVLANSLVAPTLYAAQEIVSNSLGMRFVRIPTGDFIMGNSDLSSELLARIDEQPAHSVVFTQELLMGQTEVTQAHWLAVMENRPGPDEYWQRADWARLPVVSVSWNMAQRFVEELTRMDAEYNYRLPTEAEWEYAARAGNSAFRSGETTELRNYAWFIENSEDRPHPVMTRTANNWGLYDMLGNAWEWVQDWYSPSVYGDGSRRTEPKGPVSGRFKVRRGGSYHCPLDQIRPGIREANEPNVAYSVLGFRVVAYRKSVGP